MLPIIVESSDQEQIQNYLQAYTHENHIPAYNVFEYAPEVKEFSIREIREIILETHHHTTEPRLFHLKNFDTASLEAQNAFLKTLEEHQEQITFMLSVEHATRLLPTIRSRARVIHLKAVNTDHSEQHHERIFALLNSPSRPSIAKFLNSVGKTEIPEVLDQLIRHYQRSLGKNRHAPSILKDLISKRNLMKHNNVDPQTVFDSALLAIARDSQKLS